MVILNPSASNETYVFGNNFSGGSHLWAEVMGGVPYNSTQPVRLRVNDNSFTMPNNNFPGTDAITFKGLIAEKASTRKVMAHGNTISFDDPGAWETGIYAENCPEVLIAANDIVGPQTSVRLIGIHVNNSSDGDVKNNYLSMLHDGIRISGVQTAVNYQGTQYTCNSLSNCSIGMYFNGADIETQGPNGFATENQFFGTGISGSIISPEVYLATLTNWPSGAVVNLQIQSGPANSCTPFPNNRPSVPIDDPDLKVYPNPVGIERVLFFDRPVQSDYQIFNFLGQQVKSSNHFNEITSIVLEGLKPGSYFLKLNGKVYQILIL
jgi:hypothetical protein